ncbi:hypothetical protein PRtIB026_A08570 [Pseudomonas sp. RtIB026]|nr:hypothetical protein PRtIB026_A08570 [Pseudomonas sp. RtIB026]
MNMLGRYPKVGSAITRLARHIPATSHVPHARPRTTAPWANMKTASIRNRLEAKTPSLGQFRQYVLHTNANVQATAMIDEK